MIAERTTTIPKFAYLSTPVLIALSLLGAGVVARIEYASALDPGGFDFLARVFCLVGSLVLLCSRCYAFSIAIAWTLLTCVTVISTIKFFYLGVSLSAFDEYYYLHNTQVVNFLSRYFLLSTIILLIVVVLSFYLAIKAFKQEQPHSLPRSKIAILILCSALTDYFSCPTAAVTKGGVGYCLTGHRVSCFFSSFANLRDLLSKSQLETELLVDNSNSKYNSAVNSATSISKPDIILVLMESAVPPSLYPDIKAPAYIDQSFKSADSNLHFLRTETFGGGTLASIMGVMSSLSSLEFGWMRPYVSITMEGRIHHSLSQFLQDS